MDQDSTPKDMITIIDVQKLDTDYELSVVVFESAYNNNSINMRIPNLHVLEFMLKTFQADEKVLVIVNHMEDEIVNLFDSECNNIIDLKTYMCPTFEELYEEVKTCATIDKKCDMHQQLGTKCACLHTCLILNWLTTDVNVMRLVCACIKKYSEHGLQSFNSLDWKYLPETFLLLFANKDIPIIWDTLPVSFKSKYPEYQYCEKHHFYTNTTPMKKDCIQCMEWNM